MEANLTSPIGLAEITAAAGVPGRTLLEHFRRYKGISPMGYLRRARFVRVREALRPARASENVTGIAMSLGLRIWGGFRCDTASASGRARPRPCCGGGASGRQPANRHGPASCAHFVRTLALRVDRKKDQVSR